ncbi:S-adenosyl-L-methionine-dependent methyltransferases superfamily protein [Artemisia annua]|uniref:S-adenosyl-L-methionine-dependent methyltransferases superfamily protein n=1 Tax=Artemisia annua TaxID=35608 RepID=A0A2U1LMA1_ARTAN|nr:S-adenosyl-L-methionine-dependent methyltransferases superfamily protein [Artemisia annua]
MSCTNNERESNNHNETNEEEEEETVMGLGSYKGKVRMVNGDPSDEMILLWGLQQPMFSKANAFVAQSSLNLSLDACGRCLSISQSPSSLGAPGVTGSVMWDSGIVLGKFLEHAVETGQLVLQGKKVVELGAGCGLVGCIAALLGSQVILTDMPDRLRLLKKNVEDNLYGNVRGSATVNELMWGDRPDRELVEPLPDFVIGSDVIYSEEAVTDLLETLIDLSGIETTIILAGELRNDAVLEYFMEAAMENFIIGRVDQEGWHPDYHSPRVAMYVMVKKVTPQ